VNGDIVKVKTLATACIVSEHKMLFDLGGGTSTRSSTAWKGNDQGETDIRINTNHAAKALENSWLCKHGMKERLKYGTTSWTCSGDHSHSVTVFWCCVELKKTQILPHNCCSDQSREMAKQKTKNQQLPPLPKTIQWKRKSSIEEEWRKMNFKVPKRATGHEIPF